MLYVIQVRTGDEHRVLAFCRAHLLGEKEEIFVPTYERQKKIRGEMQTTVSILFPGYVFYRTKDPESVYQKLKSAPGMTKLLKNDEEYAAVYPEEESLLLQMCGRDHNVEMSLGVIENDQVRILSGPLQNLCGRIRKIDRHKCIAIVTLQMLGREQDVTLGLEIIRKES